MMQSPEELIKSRSAQEMYDNTRLCVVPYATYGAGEDGICIRRSDGAIIALGPQEIGLLEKMSNGCKTMDEWLQTLCQDDIQFAFHNSLLRKLSHWSLSSNATHPTMPVKRRHNPIYRRYFPTIQSLLANGLLVPVSKMLEELTTQYGTMSSQACRITTLCIPTCGRSGHLQRSAGSFSHSLRLHGRNDSTILIVDDSPNPQTQHLNRKTATDLEKSDGPKIAFVGYSERERFMDALVKTGVASSELIRFALLAEKLSTTEGAVRNTMMLMTSGQHILQSDDDTYCAYARHTATSTQVKLAFVGDPYDTFFFPDRKSNLEMFPTADTMDPFALHESVLGKTLLEVTSQCNPVSWDNLGPAYVVQSLHAGKGRIDITTTGISGDSGRSSSVLFLTTAPVNTLRRVYASPESYRVASDSREIFRIIPELTINRAPTFQAMSFAINNTRLQPPFFPVGRNLDGAFALLYHMSDRDSYIGHVPFAICHESEASRSYHVDKFLRVSTLSLTDALQICLTATAPVGTNNLGKNLRCIGEQLVEIGSMPPKLFSSFLLERYIRTRVELISELGSLVARTLNVEGPWYREWVKTMHTMSSHLRAAVRNSSNVVPWDIKDKLGENEALLKTQAYVLRYGQLMCSWEEMHLAARSIHVQ